MACLFPSQSMAMVTIRGTESMEGVMGRILPKVEAEEGVLREEDSMAAIEETGRMEVKMKRIHLKAEETDHREGDNMAAIK